MVTGQNRADLWRGTKDPDHPLRFDPAREVHDIPKMDGGLIRMAMKRPLHQAASGQRLLWRALRDLDIGVYGTVIVVQWKACR